MTESLGYRSTGTTRTEKHWLYHPMLDGDVAPAEDPLVEKARRLRESDATILTDVVRAEGQGVVHVLEWVEGPPAPRCPGP